MPRAGGDLTVTPPRTRGLTGAERLRRGARALFVVVALAAYGAGLVTGCLARLEWHR